jgi:hypothetical protein
MRRSLHLPQLFFINSLIKQNFKLIALSLLQTLVTTYRLKYTRLTEGTKIAAKACNIHRLIMHWTKCVVWNEGILCFNYSILKDIKHLFYILLTVHHIMILGNWPTWCTNSFLCVYFYVFKTLYMFWAHSAHHQERQIVSIQPLVTVSLCWRPRCVQVGRRLHTSRPPK